MNLIADTELSVIPETLPPEPGLDADIDKPENSGNQQKSTEQVRKQCNGLNENIVFF